MSTNRNTRDPRQIEADLDRTRARMGHTLDVLQQKFSPGELFDQTLSYMRASGGSGVASNIMDTITRNPLPVTLVGIGLAWLAISGRRDRSAVDPSLMGEYSDTGSGDPYHPYAGSQGSGRDMDPSELTAYAHSELSDSRPSDEVAEGLDEASPTSDKTATMSRGASHTSGPSDEVAEGLDEASSTAGRSGRTAGARSST
jgi:hypothetical protein